MSYASRAQTCPCLPAKQLLMCMDEKKTNLCLSADVTTAADLLMLAELLGPEICLLKTHIDIIQDFTPALTQQLRQLARQYQFFIFEDRKFADIGNTVKQQYAGGIYHIAEWADCVNAHVLPGPSIIKGLYEVAKPLNRGLILLAEMSSAGHLMNDDYKQKTLAMAETLPDFIMGFITQQKLSDNVHWINLTPGVQLSAGTDALGQQYVTPHKAIVENGSDVIIVGRGIIRAENPLAEAKKYRENGWQSYLQRCSQEPSPR